MKIIIPLKPVGQMRARHGVINGHSRTYKAGEQRSREASLMAMLAPYKPAVKLSGPLVFGVKAYLEIPQSKSKKWKSAALAGEIRPTVKPDLDNIMKHIKDCLTGLEFWDDDKLIVEYLPGTGKYYSDMPRWEIEILPMEVV